VNAARPRLSFDHLVSARGASLRTVPDLSGVTPSGVPLTMRFGGSESATLVLFLGTRCDGCADLWGAAIDPSGCGLRPTDRIVVVTREPGGEATELVVATAPAGATVVMSAAAWVDYSVSAPPYFLVVEGQSASVMTEGVPFGLEHLASCVRRAQPPTPS
jgi:hypothetical protein